MRLDTFSPSVASAGPLHVADSDFVGDSDAFRYMRFRLEQVAATNATVLLLGETGTGKGMAAHAVHRLSGRRDARFVTVDCTSLPATLIDRLLMAQPGTAEAAAAVADERLNTLDSAASGDPYTELFGSWEASAVHDGDVLALDLLPADGRPVSFWPQLLFNRDLLFLAW